MALVKKITTVTEYVQEDELDEDLDETEDGDDADEVEDEAPKRRKK